MAPSLAACIQRKKSKSQKCNFTEHASDRSLRREPDIAFYPGADVRLVPGDLNDWAIHGQLYKYVGLMKSLLSPGNEWQSRFAILNAHNHTLYIARKNGKSYRQYPLISAKSIVLELKSNVAVSTSWGAELQLNVSIKYGVGEQLKLRVQGEHLAAKWLLVLSQYSSYSGAFESRMRLAEAIIRREKEQQQSDRPELQAYRRSKSSNEYSLTDDMHTSHWRRMSPPMTRFNCDKLCEYDDVDDLSVKTAVSFHQRHSHPEFKAIETVKHLSCIPLDVVTSNTDTTQSNENYETALTSLSETSLTHHNEDTSNEKKSTEYDSTLTVSLSEDTTPMQILFPKCSIKKPLNQTPPSLPITPNSQSPNQALPPESPFHSPCFMSELQERVLAMRQRRQNIEMLNNQMNGIEQELNAPCISSGE